VQDLSVERLLDEIERLQLVEQLLGVAHWGIDALWSTSLRPDDFPHTLDELWGYVHTVVEHDQTPDAGRSSSCVAWSRASTTTTSRSCGGGSQPGVIRIAATTS
jgi:hypothetical protein